MATDTSQSATPDDRSLESAITPWTSANNTRRKFVDVQIDEGQVQPQVRSDLGPHTELWRLLFRALASSDSDPTILRTIAITRWEGDGTHGVVLAKHAIGTIK